MSSLKEHRINKANSRTLVRGPNEGELTGTSLLNRDEILDMTFNNESVRQSLLLGPIVANKPLPSLPPNTHGYHCNGEYTKFLLREMLIVNRHIFAHCAPNKGSGVATNVTRTAVSALTTGTVESLRFCQLGALLSDLPDRSATLMILYEHNVLGSAVSDDVGKINVIYQTCTSSVSSSTLTWKVSKASMNINAYISKCFYVTDSDLVPMPGVTGVTITSENPTSKLIVKPPSNVKTLFFCSVRDREHYVLINNLFALTNIPSSG
uniref:VP11 protein n=1 Tax=Kadipiro virus TaxID=104580 RepID=A0A8E0NAI4_9REOV|nr:TPA: VP11 protein [Kadipiro virus]